MSTVSSLVPSSMEAIRIDEAEAVEVGEGCLRRALPGVAAVRVWVVDMAPGAQWPHVDRHDTGESYYVVSGEVIEGEVRHGAGTYVSFAPGSRHQPRTETGVRLIGFNASEAAFVASGGDERALSSFYLPMQG
jgi:hypothetical protein